MHLVLFEKIVLYIIYTLGVGVLLFIKSLSLKIHFNQYNCKDGWVMMIADNKHQLKVCTNKMAWKWQNIVRQIKHWFYDKRVGYREFTRFALQVLTRSIDERLVCGQRPPPDSWPSTAASALTVYMHAQPTS